MYLVYGDDFELLPAFPIDKPANFQILESDCKMNAQMCEQLQEKFFECQNSSIDVFIAENLSKILTDQVAALFSWNGAQGTVPVAKFKVMKVLIGWLIF